MNSVTDVNSNGDNDQVLQPVEKIILQTNNENYNNESPSESKIIELAGDGINCSMNKNPGGLIIVKGKNNVVKLDNPIGCSVRA